MTARTVLVVAMLALTLLVAAPEASAMCYYDVDDPVPGLSCGVHQTVTCAKAVVKDGTCAV